MKIKYFILFFGASVLLTLVNSCQSDNRDRNGEDVDNREVNTEQESPVKMIEYLVGEWRIERILNENNEDITATEDESNQTLTFTAEARYILSSGNEKVDSGAYRMNEQLGHLYLESEVDEEPREWNVEFGSDKMTLSSDKNSPNSKLRYVYRRTN